MFTAEPESEHSGKGERRSIGKRRGKVFMAERGREIGDACITGRGERRGLYSRTGK